MNAQRAELRETVIHSTGQHWITLGPALHVLGIAGAVDGWGTSGLLALVGWDAFAEQASASIGVDVDQAITMVALAIGSWRSGAGSYGCSGRTSR